MTLHLEIVGCLLIALALLHLAFPRYFDWARELRPLSLMNRQMMWVHTFFIALAVLLMGVLCVTCPDDLAATPLGRRVACGLAIFWGARLVVQFVGYSAELWRGKTFETIAHIGSALLWAYVTGVFCMVASSS